MSTEFINDQWRLPNEENKSKVSNYSMDFDAASSDYIDFTGLPDFGGGSLSISFWIKSGIDSSNAYVLMRSGFSFYIFQSGTASNLRYRIQTSSLNTINGGAILDNNWHHCVMTFDSTANEFKVFEDGNQVGSTVTTSGSLASSTSNVYLATYSTGAPFKSGQFDGLSFFDYALSSSQVTTLYGSSSTGIGNPMSLSPKPVAYYPLGDQDSFNGSNYLVPNSSLKDYVFDFNSSNQTSITVSNFNYTIYTASVWFKPNTNISTSTTQQFLLYFNTAYSPVKYIRLGGGSDIIGTTMGSGLTRYHSGSDIPANQWANVTISFNNGYQYSIFLNGVDVTDTYAAALGSSSGLIIGERAVLPAGFDGEISNVLIWDTQALSATEIETLYNNGSPIKTLANIPQSSNLKGWWKLDASDTYDGTNWTIEDHAGSNDGTSSGMTQANLVQSDLSFTSGYSPYALEFDSASSDYIDLGTTTDFDNGDLSVSIWLYASSTRTSTAYAFSNSGSASIAGFDIALKTNNEVRFRRNTRTKRNDSNWVSIGFTDDAWHNLVLTYEESTNTLKQFLDGQLKNTFTGSTASVNASIKLTIGSYNAISSFFLGQISNASIWNTELTSAQVSEIYNEGVPSNLNNHSAYSNLVSWWQLGSNSSFNTNWTVLDEKGSNNGTSVNMGEDAIVDGVGSYANGLSSGMGGDEVIGDAPYSTANALSVNMDVEDRVTDTPS